MQPAMQPVIDLCRAWTDEQAARTLAVYVGRGERILLHAAFGHYAPLGDFRARLATQPDTIFLVASLTKPLTCAAVCLLVERGQVALDAPVSDYIPAFSGADRQGTRVRHLLTHTSGLPDMLPENEALRRRHAPLSAFVAQTCVTPLLFAPGAGCRYQSMGILLAAAIAERVAGAPLPVFVQREFCAPLGMHDTFLGLGALSRQRIARVILPLEQEAEDWTWNSLYWRDLGAPWGGLHTTAADYARFLRLMLEGGRAGERRILGEATVQAMVADQVASMATLPAAARRKNAWGLGWRLNRPAGASALPRRAASARCFGHGGATGTVAWADPESGLVCVILTNDPQSDLFRARLSEVVAECGAAA